MFFDMHTMNNDGLSVRILHELRDMLDDLNAWSLIDEGTWEEYARVGGAYCPLTWDAYDEEEDYLDAAEAARDYITELEARASELGYACGADGYAGVYRIDYVGGDK